MSDRPPRRSAPLLDMKTPLGFKLWFAFCAVLGFGLFSIMVWLVIAAINWLNRH